MKSCASQKCVNGTRSGAVAPLIAILLVPLLSMVAFMVDYGYLTVVQTDLQRAADGAALAGVMDLVPNATGTQNFAAARNRARYYANLNMGFEPHLDAATGSYSYQFDVLDADIVTGKFDPSTMNGTGNLVLNTSTSVIHDTMRVTVRRDSTANSPVTLFFAQVMGIGEQDVTATATAALRKPSAVRPGTAVLPFALPLAFWNTLEDGDDLSIFNDNKIEDEFGNQVVVTDPETGGVVPGNWGTVDLGYENNSTHDLSGQIREGLRQADVDSLYLEGRLTDNTEVPLPVDLQADPGMSQGMKDSVGDVVGQTRIIPIYDHLGSGDINDAIGGNTVDFHIVRWGVVKVTGLNFAGNKNTYISAEKSYTYDGALRAINDLSDPSDTGFDGIFASPVLVR